MLHENRLRISLKVAVLCSALLLSAACQGNHEMKSYYPQASVEPVVVRQLDDQTISLRYRVPPESMYYSKSVHYPASSDVIRVHIGNPPIFSCRQKWR